MRHLDGPDAADVRLGCGSWTTDDRCDICRLCRLCRTAGGSYPLNTVTASDSTHELSHGPLSTSDPSTLNKYNPGLPAKLMTAVVLEQLCDT